jgi:hypothetical protein
MDKDMATIDRLIFLKNDVTKASYMTDDLLCRCEGQESPLSEKDTLTHVDILFDILMGISGKLDALIESFTDKKTEVSA